MWSRSWLLVLLAVGCSIASEERVEHTWNVQDAGVGARTSADPEPAGAERGVGGSVRRARAVAAASWMRLISEYARNGAGAGAAPSSPARAGAGAEAEGGWFPRPVPITLPIGRGGAELPVLIVPVPVPTPLPPHRNQHSTQCVVDNASPRRGEEEQVAPPPPPSPPPRLGAPQGEHPRTAPRQQEPRATYPEYSEEPDPPRLSYIVSSQQLVELYREQAASEPELPPALIPDYTAGEDAVGAPEAEPEETGGARRARHLRVRQLAVGPQPQVSVVRPAAPPVPQLQRSLKLRGELTVPRSGYTEPYTVWWDAASGAARVDLHGGATSAYRTPLADGRVQAVEMRVDRSGEGEVRHCTVGAPRAREQEDQLVPAFPDMEQFTFAGYSEAEFGRVERWTRTVSGRGEEAGGVRGEVLTYRHEVVVARAPDNYTSTPLRYSVAVDSSVLGADCDGYVHRYTELRDQHHEPALLHLDTAEACERVEAAEGRHRVEPLREYTLPTRDNRYDDDYRRFKTEHRRQYMDDTEEAVRKTLMVQHSRFVDSGNRQGATFSMEVNYLGDRLQAELSLLGGVREEPEGLPAEPFPHSREQLAALRASLPRAFDWRERGAVTHVRYQGSCSTCWAFAVAGAVEGALYVRTRRLVPLSEQCLVDCAQPYGGHGCGRTWPSAAYDYITERGLPALDNYTPYKDQVLTCLDRRVPPVTHIASHVNVTRNSVQALKVAIRRHAPSVVIIDATPKSFQFYKSGVLVDDRCRKNSANHAVVAVGWGSRRREPHFILKNSWSAAWGEGGYVRVGAASNTCGVLSRASYPRLERHNVDAALAQPADPRVA